MMKKRLLTLLGIAACALTACGGSSGDPQYDDSGNRIVKILVHVDSKDPEGIAYKKRVDAFNAAYKDQKIKAVLDARARTVGGADYAKQLLGMKLENKLPDIITFDAPNCANYANAGLLYNIDSYITEEERNDFLSLNTFQGKVYGLPIQESSAGFYYNKALFAQAGIDVSGITVENPWTFEQFKEACAKLKNIGTTPVDMRLDATKDETAPYLLYPFIYAAGGSFVSEDGMTAKGYMNSDGTKKGFQFIRDLITSEYTGFSIGATDFFTGKVGMYLSSGWTIPDLDHNFPQQFPNRDTWGLLPYPKDVTRASATGSWSYAITNNGISDKTAALELLKWMTSAESTNVVTDATGMIPSRKSCNPNYAQGSPEKVLLDQLSQTGIERPNTIGYPSFSSCFNNIIYKLRGGDVSKIVEDETANFQSILDNL